MIFQRYQLSSGGENMRRMELTAIIPHIQIRLLNVEFLLGNIHILRKHFNSTKPNLNWVFCQDERMSFSTLDFDEFFSAGHSRPEFQ